MDQENSQQAREFLRTYVNGNRKLITDWLDGSGNAKDVGSHLLCIMLEREGTAQNATCWRISNTQTI